MNDAETKRYLTNEFNNLVIYAKSTYNSLIDVHEVPFKFFCNGTWESIGYDIDKINFGNTEVVFCIEETQVSQWEKMKESS